jgi:hypothetical protein
MILVRHMLPLSPSNTILYLFPQPSRIPDDSDAPSVAYSLRLTLFYIYFPQPSRIPDDPGTPRVPLRHHLLPALRSFCRRLLDLFPRPP